MYTVSSTDRSLWECERWKFESMVGRGRTRSLTPSASITAAGGQIVPFPLLVPGPASMAGSEPNPQSNRYTHNDVAFVEYNTRLQSNNLPTFTNAASKFTEWLGSDKAYYPNARGPVCMPPRPSLEHP